MTQHTHSPNGIVYRLKNNTRRGQESYSWQHCLRKVHSDEWPKDKKSMAAKSKGCARKHPSFSIMKSTWKASFVPRSHNFNNRMSRSSIQSTYSLKVRRTRLAGVDGEQPWLQVVDLKTSGAREEHLENHPLYESLMNHFRLNRKMLQNSKCFETTVFNSRCILGVSSSRGAKAS